jgi:4-amino-4-deoxy-L-arabinose transferase-like glycosyltransferase
MLSLNIASRSFAGLWHHLDLEQSAPRGYLWAVRAATLVGGMNEFALRFVALVAGMVLPYAVWRVARRLVEPGPALIAAAFTALSPILVRYSVSVKPYETDALAAVLLVGLTSDVIAVPAAVARWWRLAAGGVAALVCSTPAAFVLAGCGAALVAAPAVRTQAGTPVRLLGTASVWVAAFCGVYFAVQRAEATSPYLQRFWEAKFLVPALLLEPRKTWGLLDRLPVQAFVAEAALFPLLILAWLVFLGGLGHLGRGRERRWRAVLLAGPMVAALGASMVRRYPVTPRLWVFTAPAVLIVLAAGVAAAFARWREHRARWAIGSALAVWLVALILISVNPRFLAPATRPLVAELEQQPRDSDPVYVNAGAVPAWTFYTTDWTAPDTARVRAILRAERVTGNAFQNAIGRGHAVSDTEGTQLVFAHRGRQEVLGLATGMQWREGQWFTQEDPDSGWAGREASRIRQVTDSTVWLLFANVYGGEMTALLAALQQAGGRVVYEHPARGAVLYRYRLPKGARVPR